MTVKNSFRTIYGIIAGLLLVLAVLSIVMLRNQTALTNAQQKQYLSFRAATELRQSSEDLTSYCRTYVSTGDPQWEKKYNHVLDVRNGKVPRPDGRTIALRDIMKELGFTDAEFAKLDTAENFSNDLVWTERVAFHAVKGEYADADKNFTIRKEPDLDFARRIVFDKAYHNEKKKIMTPIDEFFIMVDTRTKDVVAKYAQVSAFLLTAIIVTIIVIVLVVLGSYVWGIAPILHLLGGEPKEMSQITRRIAEGDLSVTFDKNRKVEGVYRSMLLMKEKLQEIISGSLIVADSLSMASQHVSSASQVISKGAGEQAASTEEVSVSIEEISVKVQKNSNHTLLTQKIAREVRENMLIGSEDSKTATAAIATIAEKVQVINQIAKQSNILALNASVEAARSGEHGKGFAVVAAEVQKLAEDSRHAAQEIVELAQGAANSAKIAGEHIAAVLPKMENTTQLIHEIALSSEEQSTSTENVSSAVQQLNQVTQQNAAASEQLSAAATELDHSAKSLQDLLSYFKV